MLPETWRPNERGDIMDGHGEKSRPAAYKIDDGVMVAGVRTADELRAIADYYDQAGTPPTRSC